EPFLCRAAYRTRTRRSSVYHLRKISCSTSNQSSKLTIMKQLFDDLSLEVSRFTTRRYSTSFSLGIYFLSPAIRNSIYSIYGFVRVADEIVDSFEGYDKKELLTKFRTETYEAIDRGISTNPILNSFQAAD